MTPEAHEEADSAPPGTRQWCYFHNMDDTATKSVDVLTKALSESTFTWDATMGNKGAVSVTEGQPMSSVTSTWSLQTATPTVEIPLEVMIGTQATVEVLKKLQAFSEAAWPQLVKPGDFKYVDAIMRKKTISDRATCFQSLACRNLCDEHIYPKKWPVTVPVRQAGGTPTV